MLFKLQAEFRALGHRCEIALRSRDRRTSRVVIFASCVALAGRPAIAARLSASDSTSWTPPARRALVRRPEERFGGYRADRCMYAAPTASSTSTTGGCSTITLPGCSQSHGRGESGIPASRLSQVAAAARLRGSPDSAQRSRSRVRRGSWLADVRSCGRRTSWRLTGVSRQRSCTGARRGHGLLFCGSWDHVKGISICLRRSMAPRHAQRSSPERSWSWRARERRYYRHFPNGRATS